MKRILARAWIWLLCTAIITAGGVIAVLLSIEAIKGDPIARMVITGILMAVGIVALAFLTVWALENYDD